MGSLVNSEGVVTSIVIAIIFAVVKLFWDVQALKTQAEPLLEWWKKTSIDALKIATNPTSERLTELAERYAAGVRGDRSKMPLNLQEKQELIAGLKEIMNDPGQYPSKRQSASISLRFIETREGLSSKSATANH